MLNSTQIETFKMALGKWNAPAYTDRAALIDAGDDICGSIVTTHETLDDHVAARGRKADETVEVDGSTLHIWNGVQVSKGQPRQKVYFMQFDGIAAAMIG